MISTALGEIATLERSGVKPSEISSGTTYVGLEHIDKEGSLAAAVQVEAGEIKSNKLAFGPDHVLFGKLRPNLGKVADPRFDGICSTDIIPIRPGPDLDRRFLFQYLRTPRIRAEATRLAVGINLPRLKPDALAEFEIPLPPIEEQRRIAAILDAADALRAKRRQALAKLDTLTQAIFIDMFGDTAREGEITELKDLVRSDDKINYGVVQPGSDYPNGHPLVRAGDLKFGAIDHSDIKLIDPDIDAKYERSRLIGDEILVSCVGSIGEVALVQEAEAGWNIARAVARVPIDEGLALRSFVAAQLRGARVQRYFDNELRTVSQPTLNIKQIKLAPVLVPSMPSQQKFVEVEARLEKERSQIKAQESNLDSLFASLQQRAFRGEL